MCHSLTLCWQRLALLFRPEIRARYENDIVRCCRRVPELYLHSRIHVVQCEKTLGMGLLLSCSRRKHQHSLLILSERYRSRICTISILIISNKAVQISSNNKGRTLPTNHAFSWARFNFYINAWPSIRCLFFKHFRYLHVYVHTEHVCLWKLSNSRNPP